MNIPEGITVIEEGTFNYCTKLTSIVLPESVTKIGDYAFNHCTRLYSINIPHGVTSIGSYAFPNCTRLSSIVIPDTVTAIGLDVFSGCTALSSITIPDGVTTIPARAFSDCTGLSSVTIPKSITRIDTQAFYSCLRLSQVYYYGTEEDWNNISIGSGNSSLTKLTPIYITPYTVTKAEISGEQCVFSFDIETPVLAEATLLVGVYDENDCLIGIRTCSVDLSSGSVSQSNFAVGFNGVPYQYKILLWQDLTGLTPIMESHSKPF